jgi:hypothetical protein
MCIYNKSGVRTFGVRVSNFQKKIGKRKLIFKGLFYNKKKNCIFKQFLFFWSHLVAWGAQKKNWERKLIFKRFIL